MIIERLLTVNKLKKFPMNPFISRAAGIRFSADSLTMVRSLLGLPLIICLSLNYSVTAWILVLLGGLTDVADGWLGWAIAFSPAMFFIAALSSALVGCVFGFVPARRAALLDPVLSLRSE